MKKILVSVSALLLLLIGVITFLALSHPILLKNTYFSHEIYDNQHHLLRLTLTQDQKYRVFVPLKSISPFLTEATILQEDKYFYNHPGVNFFSLAKAAWRTYVMRHRQGASTITMQVARLAYHLNTRRLPGKLLQVLRAFQIEWHY